MIFGPKSGLDNPRVWISDLGPNCFPLWMVFLKEFFENVDFKKKTADDKKNMQNYPACSELNMTSCDVVHMMLLSSHIICVNIVHPN